MHSNLLHKILLFVALLTLMPADLSRAQYNHVRELSTQARVSLLTASPGSELYTIFGHTALRVRDPINNIDRAYNYGTFDFDTDGFYRKFALGNLQYFLSVNPYETAKQAYLKDGRTITEQLLNLSPQQTQRLYNYLQTNARPQNRYYSYKFFYDNCTTRVYQALKAITGNSLRFQKALNPGQKSFRQFISPYLEPVPWTKFGVNLLLGLPADRVPSGPQTLFLPKLLKVAIASAQIQRADNNLALVAKQIIYAPVNPARINSSLITPAWAFWLLLAFVAPLSFIFRNPRTFWRWLDRFLFGIVGLVGILILYLWLFSSYPSTKWNWNIFWTLPMLFLLHVESLSHKEIKAAGIIIILIILAAAHFFNVQMFPVAIGPLLLLLMYRMWIRSNESWKARG